MNLIEFPEQNVVVAKDQPQYRPMPAHKLKDDVSGRVVFCWKLTPEEIEAVVKTGEIWHTVMTFNQPLQPQLLTVEKPELPQQENKG